jgi:hypothetical protein
MGDVRYKVSAKHTNARAYRHFYGQESRAPAMEGGSRVASMFRTVVDRACGSAAMLAGRLARGFSRTPMDDD